MEHNEAAHLDFLRRWFSGIYEAPDAAAAHAAIDRGVHPTCQIHGLPGANHGPAGFKPFYDAFTAAFESVRVDVVEVLSCGDRCAFRANLEVRAKNGRVSKSTYGGGIIRITDGQISEAWNTWDWLTVFTEVGVLPGDTFAKALVGAATPA